MDWEHECAVVTATHHRRWHLLTHFNASLKTVRDMLSTETVATDLQAYISARLSAGGYSQTEIQNTNTLSEIRDFVRRDQTAFWIFNRLWQTQPEAIMEFSFEHAEDNTAGPGTGQNHSAADSTIKTEEESDFDGMP